MYSRRVGDRTLSFGHEGVLYKNSFVMYDKETGSLWVHATGECVKGPLKGKRLTFLGSAVTSWKRWKEIHPETKVLTGDKADGFMGTFDLRRKLDLYGLSVGQGDRAKLYPYAVLASRHVVNDEFDGKKIVVALDPETMIATAFERGQHSFEWKDARMCDETGRSWNPASGSCANERLVRLPSTNWLISRWNGFYPEGDVFGSEGGDGQRR